MNTEHRNTTETPVEGHAPSLLPAGRKFRLAWADEFDGDALDESVWSYRTTFWGRDAHWFAHPEDKTVDVRNGCLHLRVAKRPDGQFVSPQLQTGQIVWDYPDNGNTTKFWGCDQTLSERKGRNRAGRCVIERRCAAMTQSARFFCRAKSSGLKMAACGIAANGGVRCHGRHFPGALCVPLHGQFLVAPIFLKMLDTVAHFA